MATGTVKRSCVSRTNTNFARLFKLLIDVGTKVLRDLFDSYFPPHSLTSDLLQPRNRSILDNLRSSRSLFGEQWNKLYPTGGSTVNSKSFDITLLSLLLRSICNLPTPNGGWNNQPAPTSTNKEDDVVRIKLYRNLYGHITETAISDADFNQHWHDIVSILLRLGGAHYQKDIDELRVVTMDPEMHQELKQDVELCSKKLKSSTKRQTEFQPKLMASHSLSSARTDDIFTNLTIQRGRKHLYASNSKFGSNSQFVSTPIKTCQEIFIRSEEDASSAKSILVIGEPGIGKTLFCQKLVRDWANDELFTNESNTASVGFDFVYLLTFRQLNLLEDKELNLRELLNHSPFLDEHSNIDESLFEYIIEHPEKVLFILDGYDEYARHGNIEGNLEEKYANNPRDRMPVDALVSKLIRKKVFTDATVMVTSRPQEADRLGRIHFDALAEVAGFSPEQVKEFIGKYFQSKPKITNRVRDHIVNNESLLSTAHIPMLCFLMCWCLEWQIESNEDLPNTITDLYSQVVKFFEMKHHSITLDKLSKLAAETMVNKKFIFQEADLQEKFSISCEEAEVLKASGLLTCCPGIRTTPFMITLDYCFSHLTLHEYFAACEFVKNNEVPPISMAQYESSLVPQFMSGLLGRERNETTMEQLMQAVILDNNNLLSAICLFEYNDEEFGLRMIKKYHHCFCTAKDREGYLYFPWIVEVDCAAVSYFLNLLSEFNRENKAQKRTTSSPEPFLINGLYYNFFAGAAAGAKHFCDSLKKQFCPITSLVYITYISDNKCRECLEALHLPSTNITTLCLLYRRNTTDSGLECFCKALVSPKITNLRLVFRCISDVGLQHLSKWIQSTNIDTLEISLQSIDDEILQCLCEVLVPTNITKLDLGETHITDRGLQYLSEALALPSSNLTELKINLCNSTDVGLQYLCDKLPTTSITSLEIGGSAFTDEGLKYLSDVLPLTNIDTLNIRYGEFNADVGLQHLCEKLQSTKITKLNFSSGHFTDVGMQYLSDVLPSTRISALELRYDAAVTDVGLQCLSKALLSTKISTLVLDSSAITDVGLKHLSKSLPSTNITTLELDCENCTDKGLRGFISEALAKLTTLKLGMRSDCITASGLQHLSKALQSSTISVLDLSDIDDINNINLRFLCELLPSMKIITARSFVLSVGD